MLCRHAPHPAAILISVLVFRNLTHSEVKQPARVTLGAIMHYVRSCSGCGALSTADATDVQHFDTDVCKAFVLLQGLCERRGLQCKDMGAGQFIKFERV